MNNIKLLLRKTLPTPLYKRISACWAIIHELPFIRFPLRFLLNRKLRKYPPVFVYQMGKVGSSSIYESLLRQYPGVVLHGHRFIKDDPHWKARELYQHGIVEKNPLLVICPVREPVGRNVSAFFQTFEERSGISLNKSKHPMEALKNLFLSGYKNHKKHLVWFDNNILENFGVDVYATPFPEEGIAVYAHNNIKLLIMRMELPDGKKVEEIRKFFGLHDFQLFNKNVGSEKEYKDIYRTFKAEIKLPEQYLSEICDSKYFRHFYSEDFIEKTKKKWS